MALVALSLALGCAAGSPPSGRDGLPLEVVSGASDAERVAVVTAAAWWAACGHDVWLDETGLDVGFVAEVPDKCGDVAGCFAPEVPAIWLDRRVPPGRMAVLAAHEIGHALGYRHTPGVMGDPIWVDTLADAECPTLDPPAAPSR